MEDRLTSSDKLKLRLFIEFDSREELDAVQEKLSSILLKKLKLNMTSFNFMYKNFDEYMEAILQRNREDFSDGHMVIFTFSEDVLKSKWMYFHDCWEAGLSPYKALTFLGT